MVNDGETTGANVPKTGIPSAPPSSGGALSPSTPSAPAIPPIQEPSIAPVPTPAPTTPPVPPTTAPSTAPEHSLQDDIDTILKGVKLPERREGAASTAAKPEQKKYDTTLGASVEETPAIVPASPPPAALEGQLSAVHTLRNDVQGVVRDQKISLVRAAAFEQEKRRPEAIDEMPVKKSHGTFGVVVALIVLVLLGAAALLGVYFVSQSSVPPPASQLGDSLVFSESTQKLPLDGQTPSGVKQLLSQMRTSAGGPLGSITRIVPTVNGAADPATGKTVPIAATFSQFMSAIGANPPDELLRALSDTFFTGIHTVDKNAPVIVVPVTSYDHAFKGMLDWETRMNADLSPYFTTVPALTTDASGLVVNRTFSDLVMRNYDVRALKDDSGTIELYYSFPTRTILIIAESPYSFPEVLSRLQADRQL